MNKERPGSILEGNARVFSGERKKEIADELAPLVAEGFMQPEVTYDIWLDTYNHATNCDRLKITRMGDEGEPKKPVAFTAGNVVESDHGTIFHLSGIIVSEKLQGLGVGKHLLREELNETGADVLAFHTQSKKMWGLGEKLAEFSKDLASKLGDLIGSRNQEGEVDRGRYGASLYGDQDKFAPSAIDDIDWKRGDAKVFAGRVKKQ